MSWSRIWPTSFLARSSGARLADARSGDGDLSDMSASRPMTAEATYFIIWAKIAKREATMEFWNYPRSPAGILALVEFAARRGVAITDLLQGSRITRAQLRAPEVEIAAVQELRVLTNLVNALGDPTSLGFDAGLEFQFTVFGVWGLGVVSSATARDAIAFALRFLSLTHAFTAITFDEQSVHGVLSFEEPDLPEGVRAFVVARDMMAAALLLRDAVGQDLAIARISMKVSAGAQLPLLLGAAIETGASANQIVVPRRVLERSLPRANPVTAAMCEVMCRQRLDQQIRGLRTGALSLRYRNTEADKAPTSVGAFARLANVSERTLKRRLKAEGTSFRALSADSRRVMAETLLADDGLSTADVAEKLGFSDLSSFSQAFKRWVGVAPSVYRKRVRESSSH
jgi:AraC-like DNA-binding protein